MQLWQPYSELVTLTQDPKPGKVLVCGKEKVILYIFYLLTVTLGNRMNVPELSLPTVSQCPLFKLPLRTVVRIWNFKMNANNSAKKITPKKLGCWVFRWECEVRLGCEVSSWVCEAKKQNAKPPSSPWPSEHCPVWVPAWPVQSRLSPVLLCTGKGLSTRFRGDCTTKPSHRDNHTQKWNSQWLPQEDASCPCGPQHQGTPTVCPQGQLFLDFCLQLRSGY